MHRGTTTFLPWFMAIFSRPMLCVCVLYVSTLCSLTQATTTGMTLQLFWNAPTMNRDSSPLQDLAGYKLYYGESSGKYTTPIDVGTPTTYTLQGLEVGHTYYIAVSAYDTAGNESALSAELIIVMTPAGPQEQVSTPLVRRQADTPVSTPQSEKAARKQKRAKEKTGLSKTRRQKEESAR
jgi:fibronectin type III domain protein